MFLSSLTSSLTCAADVSEDVLSASSVFRIDKAVPRKLARSKRKVTNSTFDEGLCVVLICL